VLVEAVIVIPLLLLLTFGAIELGLGFSQKGGLESVSRAGARKAATLAGVPDSTLNNELGLQTADAVNAALGTTSLPAEMDNLYVYKVTADDVRSYDADTNVCADDCMSFTYNTDTNQFEYADGGWKRDDREACGEKPDRVGVTVVGKFHFLTNLVGVNPIKMAPTSILQLEPTTCNG
jgi:hypothetical protein